VPLQILLFAQIDILLQRFELDGSRAFQQGKAALLVRVIEIRNLSR